MQLDIRQIAEQLVMTLWSESDKLRERAEGVKMLLQAIATEAEKAERQNNVGIEDSVHSGTTQEIQQAE